MSSFHDECGVFAVFNDARSSYMTALGLHDLQHRGQETCGIVSAQNLSDAEYAVKKHVGIVSRSFTQDDLKTLEGNFAIGHVRYATSGAKSAIGIQPWFTKTDFGSVAVAHNGNITNHEEIRKILVDRNAQFLSTIDTELILLLIVTSSKTSLQDKIYESICTLEGAFSLVIMCRDFLCIVRDKHGMRPLSLGKTPNGSYVASSETCAFSSVNAVFEREISAGEILFMPQNSEAYSIFLPKAQKHFCVFEYIYFARPDSVIADINVYDARKRIGAKLATEHIVKADIVVPVPDSGVPAALGYSIQSGIPFEMGIIRNHYIGRTFINPDHKERSDSVNMKHSPNISVINGKSIILVDDSIVRGTTSKKIVQMLFDAGAKEIHMRISSPKTKYSCCYGIDTPNSKELIANYMSTEEIKQYIGVTSLAYISLDGLYESLGVQKNDHCDACFTGEYITDQASTS